MQSEPNLLIPMGQREKIEDLVPNCLPGMQIDESDESLSGSGCSRRMDGQEVKPEAAPISLGWLEIMDTSHICSYHGSVSFQETQFCLVINDSDPFFSNLDS